MRRDVAGETVKKIAGQTSMAMTDYFTSKKNESLLQQLIHYEYYRKIEPLTIPLEFDLILNV